MGDSLGRLYERLTPGLHRRKLGQHFTRDDVADVVIAFCVRGAREVILDPSCGSGAFLLRAYDYKHWLDPSLSHDEVLATLNGIEIAEIPARLARINLARKALHSRWVAPRIVRADFLQGEATDRIAALDAIVGNPPYTRQETLPVQSSSLGRAGLHAYFMRRAIPLLKEGGRLGFVMPQAWLETQYGAQLQRAVLESCKILAIVSSSVERWFADADVNTCLVMLERCGDPAERLEHRVRFVRLKARLAHVVSHCDSSDADAHRWDAIARLRDAWLSREAAYEDDEFAVRVVPQRAITAGNDRATAPAWSTIVRAPAIFARAAERATQQNFPLLRDLCEVRFGVKSGANHFFYLTEDDIAAMGLERRYFEPIVFSLKEIAGYAVEVNALQRRVLRCAASMRALRGTSLARYLRRGDCEGLAQRPTCANRAPWYALARGWRPAPLLFPSKIGERMPIVRNAAGLLEDKKFYGITPHTPEDAPIVAALLNSTIARLFVECTSRQLTGSQVIADVDVVVAQRIPLPSPRTIDPRLRAQILAEYEALSTTRCESLFHEFGGSGAAEIELNRVKPQLRALDRLVMGRLWGLDENEQLQVYGALVEHVRARLEKARSVTRRPVAPSKMPATG